MLLYNIAMECHHEHNEILPKEPHIFDKIAVIISAICLAHCLIIPIIIIALPFLGFLAHDGWVHASLIFMAAPTSAFALWRNGGWRDPLNLTLAIIGILLGFPGGYNISMTGAATFLGKPSEGAKCIRKPGAAFTSKTTPPVTSKGSLKLEAIISIPQISKPITREIRSQIKIL